MPNQVASALLRSARSYAGQLSSLVKSFAPNHLQGGIKVHADEPTEGRVVIHIEAKGPDAHAQEYGSGLHTDARKGTKAKYPITGRPWLAFMPTHGFPGNAYGTYNARTKEGMGEKNILIIHEVQHPGIAKYKNRGYIAPAVKEFRNKINQKGSGLRQEIRQAILGEIKKSFKGATK